MTQEEKQLLLIDLCARVPYKTFVYIDWHETKDLEICKGCEEDEEEPNIHTLISCNYYGEYELGDNLCKTIYNIKPYLRPLSSMTEDEKLDYIALGDIKRYTNPQYAYLISEQLDYLNAHYFDYRGLIPMGLALEAPEGMYKMK